MDEIWERAVETALDGVSDHASVRNLTLDGAVKCIHGRLPPPSLLEKFQNLQHLSIANIGVSSLEQFPRLRNLQKLILSDNRIAGGLEHLVEAGLESLRDLDLSNNRIQYIEDLAPLAQLRIVSLDLYECPVTRVKDYRARVFGLIKSLKYLDKMDVEENERPESDDEDDEEEEEEEDPGSGEIDGEDRSYGLSNGHSSGGEGIVDVDEDDESDADEEETETGRRRENGVQPQANGFRVAPAEDEGGEDDDEEEGEDNDDNESVEEVYEVGEDEDVVEVHEIEDSDDDDGDEDDEDEDEEDEVEEIDNEDGDFAEPASTGRLVSAEGEIDAHEQGEDDGEEADDGETGEEEQGVEEEVDFEEEDDDGDEEEEDYGAGYLVQRVGQAVEGEGVEPENEEDEEEVEEYEEEDDDLGEVQVVQQQPSSSLQPKRKRDDDSGDEDEEDDDEETSTRPSKK